MNILRNLFMNVITNLFMNIITNLFMKVLMNLLVNFSAYCSYLFIQYTFETNFLFTKEEKD